MKSISVTVLGLIDLTRGRTAQDVKVFTESKQLLWSVLHRLLQLRLQEVFLEELGNVLAAD